MAVTGTTNLAVTESYLDGTRLTQAQLNTAVGTNSAGSIEYYINNTILNYLKELAGDAYSDYVFTGDGVTTYTNSLYNKQSGSSTDSGNTIITAAGADATWHDVDGVDCVITYTPEIAGKFKVTCQFNVQNISSNATCFSDYNFSLYDGTTRSNAVVLKRINIPNTCEDMTTLSISHIFTHTASSKTVRLQYYRVAANVAMTTAVFANSSVPTKFDYEKV